jgi:hypothetical protein
VSRLNPTSPKGVGGFDSPPPRECVVRVDGSFQSGERVGAVNGGAACGAVNEKDMVQPLDSVPPPGTHDPNILPHQRITGLELARLRIQKRLHEGMPLPLWSGRHSPRLGHTHQNSGDLHPSLTYHQWRGTSGNRYRPPTLPYPPPRAPSA